MKLCNLIGQRQHKINSVSVPVDSHLKYIYIYIIAHVLLIETYSYCIGAT